MGLFADKLPDKPISPHRQLFCGKYELDQAIGLLLDIKFQSKTQFKKLLAEMYSYAIKNYNDTLFKFLEARFNANVIQDKEVIINFELIDSREKAVEYQARNTADTGSGTEG